MEAKEFRCIDGHTCGNPVRLIVDGHPPLEGEDMAAKRQHFLREYDWIRRGLMFEPRGHDMMSGSFLYPPSNPENDAGILFIETSGCLPMCGHGTIGTVTLALETGILEPKKPGEIRLETPAGPVLAEYSWSRGKVEWVRITNVFSYLAGRDLEVETPDTGPLRFDVAFGGNFYAIIDPQQGFSGIQDFTAAALIDRARALRKAINEAYPERFVHPEDPRIQSVSHILWTGTPLAATSHARNAVFYGDKAIDRSPCGTGTSARMAQWHAQGRLRPGEPFVHESFIGSTFTGRIEAVEERPYATGIVPSIQGWAKRFGENRILIDPEDDPYAHGFQVI